MLHGDRFAPWRRPKGFWYNNRWVPEEVAQSIQAKVTKEVDKLKTEIKEQELQLQKGVNEMKRIGR